MPTHELQRAIEDLYARYRPTSHGEIATYIPELSKADPDDFGISIVTTEGGAFETGDHHRPFTIQSISKPFIYGIALEEFGADEVARRVTVEPSGGTGNSIEPPTGRDPPH